MQDATVKYCNAVFKIYPDEQILSIAPVDGYGTMCECELCKGKATRQRGWNGMLSDYVWNFMDNVAKEVYKTHPGKKISCLAYGGYRLPPTKIAQLSPNIVVILSQTRSSELNDYVDTRQKEHMLSIRQEWLKKIPQGHAPFLVYDIYSTGFNSTFMPPRFFPHTIASDLRSLKGSSQGDFLPWGAR